MFKNWLVLVAVICMFICCDRSLAGDTPLTAPWDMESRISKIEAEHKQMMAEIAELKTKLAQCPCVPQVTPSVQMANPTGVTSTVVRHADGSLWQQTCDSSTCTQTPMSVSAVGYSGGCATCGNGGSSYYYGSQGSDMEADDSSGRHGFHPFRWLFHRHKRNGGGGGGCASCGGGG